LIQLRDIAAVCMVVGVVFGIGGLAVSQVEEPVSASELRSAYSGAPDTWPRPWLKDGAEFVEFAKLPPAPSPDYNPTTHEKIALGRALFDDPMLSGSGQIACASCHERDLSFTDGLRTSFGHNRLRGVRNAQSLLTAAWWRELFWDGRSPTLEDQALHPFVDPVEMATSHARIVESIKSDGVYGDMFAAAFGDREISIQRISYALASFQRSLRPRASKFDRFVDGRAQLTDQELRGLHLFRTKAGCANCHNGPLLSDQKYHNIGLSYYGRELQDLGRYEATRDPADIGKFRTASLRNIRRSAPYMHNGVMPELSGVVTFYNAGGARPRPREDQKDDPHFPQTDPLLAPLNLTAEEREALVAFLETL